MTEKNDRELSIIDKLIKNGAGLSGGEVVPVVNEEKKDGNQFQIAAQTAAVIRATQSDPDALVNAVSRSLQQQANNLPKSKMSGILDKLPKNQPTKTAAGVILGGGLSKTNTYKKTTEKTSFLNWLFSGGKEKNNKETVLKIVHENLAGEVIVQNPRIQGRQFNISASASDSKAAAASFGDGFASADSGISSSHAEVHGTGVAASSTIHVSGSTHYEAESVDTGSIRFSSKK